jgi:hypothetical protein
MPGLALNVWCDLQNDDGQRILQNIRVLRERFEPEVVAKERASRPRPAKVAKGAYTLGTHPQVDMSVRHAWRSRSVSWLSHFRPLLVLDDGRLHQFVHEILYFRRYAAKKS